MGCGASSSQRAAAGTVQQPSNPLQRTKAAFVPGTAPAILHEDPPESGGPLTLHGLLKVRPTVKEPVYRWGRVAKGDIGIVLRLGSGECAANFPMHLGWRGHLCDVESFHPGRPPAMLKVSGAPAKKPWGDLNGEYELTEESAGCRWAGVPQEGRPWSGWIHARALPGDEAAEGLVVELLPPRKKDESAQAPWLRLPAKGVIEGFDEKFIRVNFEQQELGKRKVPRAWWDAEATQPHVVQMPCYPEWQRRIDPPEDTSGKKVAVSLRKKRFATVLTIRSVPLSDEDVRELADKDIAAKERREQERKQDIDERRKAEAAGPPGDLPPPTLSVTADGMLQSPQAGSPKAGGPQRSSVTSRSSATKEKQTTGASFAQSTVAPPQRYEVAALPPVQSRDAHSAAREFDAENAVTRRKQEEAEELARQIAHYKMLQKQGVWPLPPWPGNKKPAPEPLDPGVPHCHTWVIFRRRDAVVEPELADEELMPTADEDPLLALMREQEEEVAAAAAAAAASGEFVEEDVKVRETEVLRSGHRLTAALPQHVPWALPLAQRVHRIKVEDAYALSNSAPCSPQAWGHAEERHEPYRLPGAGLPPMDDAHVALVCAVLCGACFVTEPVLLHCAKLEDLSLQDRVEGEGEGQPSPASEEAANQPS
eukprot:TRINITY_DN60344_c0_g1_i1.p1 TRINITY_DN60344_c0_g1~~TRINITY_DN60344_c0_g1_i1.p1  ORF type:complete len:651 (+),score=117.37 TRINITY_DN60344_c0_g1_i1:102-2054(+)